ncbi:hypothetical protein FF38_10557 [Lucilia cuprina]|uniref:Uncharacterized protein n=1 Tax=Lucilia cuprina TaxID=7375 RepID=A0A0L0CIG6_LUCCU|nr:hypothetical protein FF38_10557 [Lucilia cuprina]
MDYLSSSSFSLSQAESKTTTSAKSTSKVRVPQKKPRKERLDNGKAILSQSCQKKTPGRSLLCSLRCLSDYRTAKIPIDQQEGADWKGLEKDTKIPKTTDNVKESNSKSDSPKKNWCPLQNWRGA